MVDTNEIFFRANDDEFDDFVEFTEDDDDDDDILDGTIAIILVIKKVSFQREVFQREKKRGFLLLL